MSRIPSNIIDQIRAQSDIVDIIGRYVTLKKAGRNYKGLCPFHKEKTPSFTVSPDKEIFYCFGCGAGGNVFSFIMQHEKVGFGEAARLLAQHANIKIPIETERDPQTTSEIDILYEINAFAARFFHHQLIETAAGLPARQYLGKQRGFNEETWRAFQLGYAPDSWNAFLKNAQKAGFSVPTLEKSGLIRKSEKGNYYDAFRQRIMFPIFNVGGRVIGFGGRTLGDDQPKYINTPETPIYQKRQSLYGIHLTKKAIQHAERVVIVEGYADVISLYQAGIENVVAPLGTSFTDDQARILSRLTRKCVLLFDSDLAGEKATSRGIDILLGANFEIQIARIPDNKDPDDFVRKYHKNGLERLLTNSKNFLDYMIENANLSSPDEKTRSVEQILQSLAKISDDIRLNFYLDQLAGSMGISLDKLASAIQTSDQQIRQKLLTQPKHTIDSHIPAAEFKLLALMLTNMDFFNQAMTDIGMDLFSSPKIQRVIELIYQYQDWNADTIDIHYILNEEANPHLNAFISKLLWEEEQFIDHEKTYQDCISKLKINQIEHDLTEVKKKMALCRDLNQLDQLSIQYKKLILQRKHMLDNQPEINQNS